MRLNTKYLYRKQQNYLWLPPNGSNINEYVHLHWLAKSSNDSWHKQNM